MNNMDTEHKLSTETGGTDLCSDDTSLSKLDDADKRVKELPSLHAPRDTYIAVIGQTGTGKTSFIADATGQDLKIGDDLEPCTKVIEEAQATIDGRIVKFIDTPGFDDSFLSDIDILRDIGDCLTNKCPEIRVTGIVYLRRISDNRMAGSALSTLRVLEQLTGEDNFGNIALVTTHWSEDEKRRKAEEKRENQLRTTDTYWKKLIQHGAMVHRHERGKESAIKIVREVLQRTPVMLKFQKELLSSGIVANTSAGQQLLNDIAKERQKDKEMIETLQQELERIRSKDVSIEAQKIDIEDKKKAIEAQKKAIDAQKEAIEAEKTTVATKKADLDREKAALVAKKVALENEKADMEAVKADKEKKMQMLEEKVKELQVCKERLENGDGLKQKSFQCSPQ